MSSAKRGLQRRSEKPRAGASHVLAEREAQDHSAWIVPIERVRPDPEQPRRALGDEALAELASDIARRGVRNPLTVVLRDDIYHIIAGERRYRAALKAGLTDVPVRVIEPENVLEEQLVENIQREDLNPVDEAQAMERLRSAGNLSIRDLGARLGRPKSTIDRKLGVLKWPEEVQEQLRSGAISFAEAERRADEHKPKPQKRGRPAVPFRFKERRDGSFDLMVKYRPGLTGKDELIEQLEDAIHKIKSS